MTTSLMRGSFYTASKGGHAPGDLRDAFLEAVDAFFDAWKPGQAEPTVELRDQQVPISKVFGLVWNCSDILPGTVWTQITDGVSPFDETYDGPRSSTYGAAARWLKERMSAG